MELDELELLCLDLDETCISSDVSWWWGAKKEEIQTEDALELMNESVSKNSFNKKQKSSEQYVPRPEGKKEREIKKGPQMKIYSSLILRFTIERPNGFLFISAL